MINILSYICFIALLKSLTLCPCNNSEFIKFWSKFNNSDGNSKSNLNLNNFISITEPEDTLTEPEETLTDPEEATTAIVETTTISDYNDTFENVTEGEDFVTLVTHTVTLNDTDAEINVTNIHLNELCYHFKHGVEIDMNRIVDVWETKYYQLPDTLPCFKILIRKITEEERKQYVRIYGDLDTMVNWNNSVLEIVSSALPKSLTRRHFLNGVGEDLGVLDNIIVLENDEGNFTIVTESPDQWWVSGNLLLMRDCDNGNIVLFTRVPYKTRNQDIVDALLEFGESGVTGKMTCEALEVQNNEVNEELSDSF